MKRIVAALGALAALALIAVASLGTADTRHVQAATWVIEGTATGAEENPPVTSPGRASVRFVFDDVSNTLTFSVTITGLTQSQVTAAHIHRGARGVNGPIVHDLSRTGFTQVSGTLNLSPADVADLRAGNFYFNAHSVEHPGGFARMQLVLPAGTQLRGTIVVPHNIPPHILAQIPPAYRAELVPGMPIEPFLLAQIPPSLLQEMLGLAGGRAPAPGGPSLVPPRTGDGGLKGNSETLLPLLFVLAFAGGGSAVLALSRRRA